MRLPYPVPAEPLARSIVRCRRCPRLLEHCRDIAHTKRRAYRDQTYWGRPVPSFGVRNPVLLVVGLAPGAHGANRTGRMFTGDASGDWLYGALCETGFASQESSVAADDGLRLIGTVITSAARCAPPGNRPTAAELENCRDYLVAELRSFRRLRVVIALGRIAFDAVRRAWAEADRPAFAKPPRFAHAAEVATVDGSVVLIASYHPSRQNTQTGRLTRAMLQRPFRRARQILDGG